MITTLELLCFALVVVWAVLRFRTEPDRKALAQQLLIIAVGAWASENSCIRLYGFYSYDDDRWALWLDRVPLLIILIWPVVVTSALDIGRRLGVRASLWPALLFVLVVADAWFIEPIAVDAGLWRWTEPGSFAVPVIGVLGWGCFAAGVGLVVARRWPFAAVVVVGPVVCHLLLLALWWGLLRWAPTSTSEVPRAVCAWIASLSLFALIVKRRPPGLRDLVWLRAPAAVFFFGLLARTAGFADPDDDRALIAWSLAFSPPWLALWLFSRPSPAPSLASASASASSAAPIAAPARP